MEYCLPDLNLLGLTAAHLCLSPPEWPDMHSCPWLGSASTCMGFFRLAGWRFSVVSQVGLPPLALNVETFTQAEPGLLMSFACFCLHVCLTAPGGRFVLPYPDCPFLHVCSFQVVTRFQICEQTLPPWCDAWLPMATCHALHECK
jgi:hypothetical protein